jgi:hypothetical protein
LKLGTKSFQSAPKNAELYDLCIHPKSGKKRVWEANLQPLGANVSAFLLALPW